MKFNDAIWGAVLLVFAGLLFVHVQGFPAIPGQKIGPSAMPGALAVGLGICGALLFLGGLRGRRKARAAGPAKAGWVELPDWFASPPQLVGFAVLVAINLLYLYGANRLGFIITGTIYLAALMWALRVPLVRALPIAIVMTLLIHYAFYKLLKVPLPWGLLQSIAW
jgi:putative tricarboxylic transport membrane protein